MVARCSVDEGSAMKIDRAFLTELFFLLSVVLVMGYAFQTHVGEAKNLKTVTLGIEGMT